MRIYYRLFGFAAVVFGVTIILINVFVWLDICAGSEKSSCGLDETSVLFKILLGGVVTLLVGLGLIKATSKK